MTGRRVTIVLGAGGTGKTTVAAAPGALAAADGRATALLAIDPARRLATALGLATGALSDDLRLLDPGPLAAAGLPPPRAPLRAAVLERSRAWNALVERVIPEAIRPRVLANPFYRGLSQTFAGAHEVLAIDRLAALAADPAHERIVVDTPPAARAVDLFEAPGRVARFFDRTVVRWFVHLPGGAAVRGTGIAADFILRRLEAATGASTFAAIADLFAAVGGAAGEVRRRAARAARVLCDSETALVLVTTPEDAAVAGAAALLERLRAEGLGLAAVIVNRAHPPIDVARPRAAVEAVIARALAGEGGDALRAAAPALAANFADHQTLARGEARRLERLRALLPAGIPIVAVPPFPAEASGLRAVAAMARRLEDAIAP